MKNDVFKDADFGLYRFAKCFQLSENDIEGANDKERISNERVCELEESLQRGYQE